MTVKRKEDSNKIEMFSEATNGGDSVYQANIPYVVDVTLMGSCDILFHRWNNESVEAKATAAKGSSAKKTDDVESYVYRLPNGHLAIPGTYLRGAIVNAAKYKQDPRSPRKSAMDLFKASIVSLTALADLGMDRWDYLDRQRAVVQRNGITRVRPAILAGWKASFQLQCNSPEYIDRLLLRDVIEAAGRLIGLGDDRPTYGRFGIVAFA